MYIFTLLMLVILGTAHVHQALLMCATQCLGYVHAAHSSPPPDPALFSFPPHGPT
jgi:hypothetical protein